MDIASIIIGIGGLLLGALTIFLSYLQNRDVRRSVYRENLYSKQLEIYETLMKNAISRQILIENILNLNHTMQGDIQSNIGNINQLSDDFSNIYEISTVFIPKPIHGALFNYNECINKFILHIQDNATLSFEHASDFRKEILVSYHNLIESIRKSIGVDQLDKDNTIIVNNHPMRITSRESYLDKMHQIQIFSEINQELPIHEIISNSDLPKDRDIPHIDRIWFSTKSAKRGANLVILFRVTDLGMNFSRDIPPQVIVYPDEIAIHANRKQGGYYYCYLTISDQMSVGVHSIVITLIDLNSNSNSQNFYFDVS